jgi:chromosome segregation ATPase
MIMALKYTVESLDGLEAPIAKLYAKGDDGKFRLGVEGVEPEENVAGLKKAHAADKAELAEMKKKLADREAKQAEIEAEAARQAEALARKSGDVAALEKSWQEKMTKRERELLEQLKAKESAIEALTVDATAQKLAAELFGDGAGALIHNVRARLRTEIVDGKPTVRVLDESGQPSAMTIDELKKSFVDNKTYARFIIGSRASGGGPAVLPQAAGPVRKRR